MQSLFPALPNARLALSGHAHPCDRVEYLGVGYSCDGAVSGNWWQGDNLGCLPGCGMVNLHDDGSSEMGFGSFDQA